MIGVKERGVGRGSTKIRLGRKFMTFWSLFRFVNLCRSQFKHITSNFVGSELCKSSKNNVSSSSRSLSSPTKLQVSVNLRLTFGDDGMSTLS